MSKFKLSTREAMILSILLREYQAGKEDFETNAVRQHIFNIRKKLSRHITGDTITGDIIISMGMGFYAIPDSFKEAIQNHIVEC